jgi:hypothetical protein
MSTTKSIALAVYEMIAPLGSALQDHQAMSHLLDDMGWTTEITEEHLPTLQQVLAIVPLIEQIGALLPTLDDMEAGEIVEQGILVGTDVFRLIDGLAGGVHTGLIASLTPPLNTTDFWVEWALDLPEYLFLRWLRRVRSPYIFRVMELFGIVRETGYSTRSDMPMYEMNWDTIEKFFADPIGLLADTYGWGGDLQYETLLRRLAQLSGTLGFAGQLQLPSHAAAGRFYAPDDEPPMQLEWTAYDGWLNDTDVWFRSGLLLLPIPRGADQPNALYLGNIVHGSTSASVELIDGLTLTVSARGEGTGALGIIFAPGEPPEIQSFLPSTDFEIGLEYTPPTPPETDGSTSLTFGGVRASLSILGSSAAPEITVEVTTINGGLALTVQPAEGDGFVRELLGDSALTASADLGIRWSNQDGLTLLTGAGIDLTIPLNLKLFGVITVLDLHLVLAYVGSTLSGSVGISASALLGPFTLTVADIGISGLLEPLQEDKTYLARLGPLGTDLAFKPPSGGGVAFDFLGIVYGGGFINHNPDKGEYSGVITVEILSIGITAIVIITTKPPDNPGGWSLFVSINVDLGSIPLGFGFTLNKVGGLIGVHRTVDIPVLQAGIRTGVLDSIMFPQDPIANAPRILSDIASVFPIAQGSFVVGAMLQIGWGVSSIITADLGLIVQVPDIIIALIGQVETILPSDDAALIEIHFDVVGVLDLAAGTLAIDAGLRDSHIVGFVLTGQMALRASFLTEPSFLLSIGGFHPAFPPPDTFPLLDRMGVGISLGDWLSISLEAYLALTSNTVQFGAGLYLTASLIGFKIEGGTDINTLIQFSPFQFRADLRFYITVSAVGVELLGVLLTGHVSGPNPYFVRGQAHFKILGLEKGVDIEETIGGESTLDDIDDVPLLDEVIAALLDPESWSAVDDGTRLGGVLLAGTDDATASLVLHPGGKVMVGQRVAPLNVELEHYGNAEIEGEDTLSVTEVAVGGGSSEWEFAEDWFAPAQFFDYSSDEKLSAPSFEKMKGGVIFGDDEADTGSLADAVYSYQQIKHDPEFNTPEARMSPLFTPDASILSNLTAQKAVFASTKRPTVSQASGQIFTLKTACYAIVDRESLDTPAGTLTRTMTYAEAAQTVKNGSGSQIVVTSSERQSK